MSVFDENINLEINPVSALKQRLLPQLHFKQDWLLVVSTVGRHGRLPKKQTFCNKMLSVLSSHRISPVLF